VTEKALTFACGSEDLVGILHLPERAATRGVVIVVGGGPQYRVGGHRQLVLWSRRLAAEGFPVLRFDYRGMGDSHGRFMGYETVDDDIRAAIDCIAHEMPSLTEIVLWGECDASSAILFYAYRDPRVKGMVLLNPWARTEAGRAKTMLKHYYLQRLMQPSFWKKLFSLRFNPLTAAGDFLRLARVSWSVPTPAASVPPDSGGLAAPISRDLPLPHRLLTGFQRFPGRVMLVMSRRDYIAREFDELLAADPAWAQAIAAKQFVRHDMAEGDHTFSSAQQRNRVVGWGLEWLRSW
jgi:exosortase A-associated hydrolase 1